MNTQPASLACLLEEDPLGTLYANVNAAEEKWSAKLEPFQHILSALRDASDRAKTDEELKRKFQAVKDSDHGEPLVALAEALNVSAKELREYRVLRKRFEVALDTAADVSRLAKEWEQLCQSAPMRRLSAETFPRKARKPFVVFYTTDWCFSCQLTKPTVARLSHHFTEAPMFYSSDTELFAQEEITFIPQFVAYFPNGSKVYSHCDTTTRAVWDTLHNLVLLGSAYVGRGRLEFDESEGKIIAF